MKSFKAMSEQTSIVIFFKLGANLSEVTSRLTFERSDKKRTQPILLKYVSSPTTFPRWPDVEREAKVQGDEARAKLLNEQFQGESRSEGQIY